MATPTSREIAAEQAMDAAESDDLLFTRSYTIGHRQSQYRIGMPPIAMDNLPVGKGDSAGVWVDFERGMLVYDLQEGEYER